MLSTILVTLYNNLIWHCYIFFSFRSCTNSLNSLLSKLTITKAMYLKKMWS